MKRMEQNFTNWEVIADELAAQVDMTNKQEELKNIEEKVRRIIEADPMALPGENNEDLCTRVKREAEEAWTHLGKTIAAEWEANSEQKQAFMDRIRDEASFDKIDGFFEGWWDLDEAGNMIAPPKKFKISDFPDNAVMAHVVAAAGIFPSISQARKNGWDKPLVAGEFVLTKKKIRIIVE